ncbi:MAG: hypothetical protein V3W20_00290, partial [Candidatus Neomarinimicrobiota bacterium]
MNFKSTKKKKRTILLILFSFIFSSILYINLSQKNQLLIDQNLFSEENVDNLNLAATIQPDWEVATTTTQDTTCTINKPSGTQEGDLLILHCTTDGEGEILTGPFGWTILLQENQSGGQTTASWYKIANASEPSSYDVKWIGVEAYVGGIIRITDHDSADPIQATATATGTGVVINPSVSTTKDDTLLIGFHGLDDDDQGDNYNNTLEPGPIDLYARISEVGNPGEVSAGMFYEFQANQGASPTRTWSIGGNEGWYAATVAINLNLPLIDITSPLENETYGVISPNFTVEILDSNLDKMWYTVDGGLNNYTFTENGTINQGAWDVLPDGIITIRFYANNSLSDINFQQVNIIKDSSAPIISIVSPIESEIFGVISPNFTVEITDVNLNISWYTVDGGLSNYTFTENGTINQGAWGVIPDGIITIRFYANNSLGNINFEDVNVTKDSLGPNISIVSPMMDEAFGVDAPNFIVEIDDANLNTSWYTVDGGFNNYTFTENGTINQVSWDSLLGGIVTIRFYANDSLGSLNFSEVNVIKDNSAPNISIVSPIMDEVFGVISPNFTVEIVDSNLDRMWYSLSNGTYVSQNRTFAVNGTVNQIEWNVLYDGVYTIRFYANDTLGNINFEAVNVTKDGSAPLINIISPVMDDAFGVTAPSFVVEITDSNLDTMWYSISN